MHNRKKRISLLAALFAVIAIPATSQINTYSPYTRFGVGNLSQDGFGQNMAMGGTGIAIQDGNKLNYMNPAAYAARDSMSVLLDFGMNASWNQYNTSTISKNWWNGSFHHIGLSLPIGKHFAMGTGLVPYSTVGYSIKQEYDNLGTGDAIDYYYKGSGGIFKYFLGISAKAFNRFSVGVNMNYLLGEIDRERSMVFPRNRGFAETRAMDNIALQHTYFGFGFQYTEHIQDKFFFNLGATYDMEATLNSAFSSYITNYFEGSPGYSDTTIISNAYNIVDDESEKPIIIPSKLGIGLAFGIPGKLTLTGDYTIQDWSKVDNSSLRVEGFNLAAAKTRRAGLEYTPDFEAFRGYHKLMSYRLGAYMNDSYVTVDDYQLENYGITFGVGLPLGRTKSSLNIGIDLGTRGTKNNNLVKENYGIISFSVTLHDLWF
ncbi:MAG: hypothetical protein PF450_04380, partial [Bacteroidales bacterium]|nr:hypothetical protein [Bacteroidales bacterium]